MSRRRDLAGAETAELQALVEQLLGLLGEDPTREGLLKTPERVAKALRFFTQGYQQDVEEVFNGALYSVKYDEMVVVRDIDFFSLCEHHLLPFYGKCHVAYIPSDRVIGLSKIPRLVEVFSRRLQVQERLTNQIADTIRDTIAPLGVAVMSAMIGAFRDNARTRMEFLELVRLGGSIPGTGAGGPGGSGGETRSAGL